MNKPEMCLRNIEQFSNQQILDFVMPKLLSQGCKSKKPDEKVHCAYRGANGTKCAIGFIMSDEEYNVKCEGWSVNKVLNYLNIPTLIKCSFLKALQYVHDDNKVEDWPEAFKNLAAKYNLTIN